MSDNLKAWNAFCRPPKEALKTIKGGRLQGMTDINPAWRLKAMTEVYGPAGEGWWYTIDGFDKHDLAGEVALLASVTVYIVGREHGIPGVGGSMLVAQEKGGMRLNDEAWKMAVTDALSVALKALGVGAEIYMGNWDGSKYRTLPPTESGSHEIDATLIDKAETAAKLGMEEYRKLWVGLSAEERKALMPRHAEMKKAAELVVKGAVE